MRAYMSDLDKREPEMHGASWQDFDGVRSVHLLQAEALYEARAILAETERGEKGVFHDHVSLSCFIPSERAALADALRAFVEEV